MNFTPNPRRITALNEAPKKAIEQYDLYRVDEIPSALLPTWDVTRWNDAERSYSVMVDEYDWTCTCPACQSDTHCKHIEIVRLHLAEMENLERRSQDFAEMEEGRSFMHHHLAEVRL